MSDAEGATKLREDPIRVLIVDDESGVRSALTRILRKADMVVLSADDGVAALELLENESFDVVLLDVRMPNMTGPQLLERMKAAGNKAEVIMMSAFADIAMTLSSVREGAYAFLTKPFAANEGVIIEVLKATAHKRLRERCDRLERELAEHDAPPVSRPRDTGVRARGDDPPTDLPPPGPAAQLHELTYAEAKRRAMTDFTEAYVAAALHASNGNMAEAARRAGLDRSNFRRLMRSKTKVQIPED